jgi:candicidin polyketide synthase FscE
VLDDGVITALTPERLDTVLGPKAHGAWHLHELTQDLDLAAFVMFSSIAAVMGSPGQGSYAAANQVLDALAAHRASRGLPAQSLAWPPWELADGMAGSLAGAAARRLRAAGPPPLTLNQGFALFDAALTTSDAFLVALGPAVTAFTPGAGRPGPAPASLPPLLWALAGITRRAAATGPAAAELAGQLAAMPAAQRGHHLADLVLAQAAAVLGYAGPAAVDSGREFRELGFDSLTAVELRNRLSAATGLRLPATLVFDYPTPAALAAQLSTQLDGQRAGTANAPAPTSLLAELDRLEAVLAASIETGAPDGVTRAGVAVRLQQLLDQWRAAEALSGPADVTDRIGRASTDEIFDFIDHQLGRLRDR